MTTVDRIADPWGSRTPYGRGQRWPTRVDTYLALSERCHPQTLRQLRWANAKLEEIAAQTVITD
ncbi:hypothetical protein NXT08_12460 [Rhodococcus pyridinivorans]|uniref:hypothetical protein n=1 Tax=Rhodococcus TaxID=1827 RepID=UPI00090AEA9A|nr:MULTISPECIES: hypothetical protein [Rhodococcus]APE10807.1 hypothetical protein BO226_17710 [Rhodococcus sp. 2G]QXU56309.1 hypothetical protein KXC42_01055 [Rhodococcus sp. LW-XY12]UVT23184.1 hypothetical protein NXT08_12460 [Rhodococcus pyridinivorans]